MPPAKPASVVAALGLGAVRADPIVGQRLARAVGDSPGDVSVALKNDRCLRCAGTDPDRAVGPVVGFSRRVDSVAHSHPIGALGKGADFKAAIAKAGGAPDSGEGRSHRCLSVQLRGCRRLRIRLGRRVFGQRSEHFYLIDPGSLCTLPEREYLSGLAEVVKYGVILDAEFFTYLEANAAAVRDRKSDALPFVVSRCCRLKADVVERDEHETTGLRARPLHP